VKSTKKEPREYHAPQVTDYGNIKQITMHIHGSGRKDGVPSRRTHA
jgi:hypothetical protein